MNFPLSINYYYEKKIGGKKIQKWIKNVMNFWLTMAMMKLIIIIFNYKFVGYENLISIPFILLRPILSQLCTPSFIAIFIFLLLYFSMRPFLSFNSTQLNSFASWTWRWTDDDKRGKFTEINQLHAHLFLFNSQRIHLKLNVWGFVAFWNFGQLG